MIAPRNLPRKLRMSFLFALTLTAASYAQNFWQQTSGPTGADVRALIVNANQTIFAGTINSGAYRSRDDGNSWTSVNNDSLDQAVLAFAQNSSGYLFAATFDGVFRSLDEGDNWTRGNTGLTTLNIRGLAINVSEDIFAGTAAGVFRSLDNGTSWTPQHSGLADTILVEDLALNSSGHVFAATFRNGVFRSTDNGNTWNQANFGLTNLFVFALAINSNGELFAGTNSGVFRSSDNGNSWATTGLQLGLVRAFAINAKGEIFAGMEGDGVLRSQDNGATWSSIVNTGLTNNVVNALALDAQGYLYAGTRGSGVFRSVQPTTNLLLRNLPDTTIAVDDPALTLSLDDYFDNTSENLFYSVSVSDSSKLFVRMDAQQPNVLRMTPLAVGSTQVLVEALDVATSFSISDTLRVTITNAAQPATRRTIYWTAPSSSSIQRANTDGTQRETLVAALPNGPIDLALDFSGGKMYWSENFSAGLPKIQRANLDGTGLETIITFSGLLIVPSIALDIPNQKIYWASNPTANAADKSARRGPGSIARANLDGSNAEAINTSVVFPIGLAVGGGKVYWYDDDTGFIERANLDGSAFEQILEQPDQQSSPLAVDVVAGKIFWISDNYLRRANLDGSNQEDLLVGAGAAIDLTLDAANRKVYWSALTNGVGAITRANYDGAFVEILPLNNLGLVYGIAVGDSAGNRAPLVANEIPDVTLVATDPGFKLVLDLRNVFRDPEEDVLSFTATSSNTTAATATITGNILTVAPADSGAALITIAADDGHGGIVSTTFTARTVTSNAAPRVVANIADQVLTKGTPAFKRALRAHFSDADGDQILFGATSSKPQVATANIQFNSDTLEVAPIDTGRATVVVFASDGKGGQAADTFNVTVYISPPPVITHTNVVQQNFNQAINLAARLTDNENAVRSATLYYREAGESNFVLVKMDTTRFGADTLNATAAIPSNAVGATGVEYYLVATDKHGVPGRAPAFGVYSVRVQIAGEGIDRGSAQTSGTAQSGYRLISVPLEVNNKNAEAVLVDDLGAYNDRQWRFYDWANDANGNLSRTEFPNTAEFAPGKAFWLIVRSSDKKIDSGPGATVSTASKFAINLRKGWNLVATPFNFASNAAPLLANGDSLLFYAYENGWSAPRRPSSRNKLEPFEGYAVFSDTATTMFILPNEFAAQSEPLPKTEASELPWSIRIAAQCQDARDENNFVVMMNNAAREWDAHDHPEPPAIGEYVSLYFPREEWNRLSKKFCTDARPLPDESEAWPFAVETNIRDEVRLSFEGLASVPQEYEVWLIDKSVSLAQDLRRNPHYAVAGRGPEDAKQLTLIINRAGKLKEEYEALQTAPVSFELSQNFPNPFNPATTIRYALPKPERVTVQVFNLLGELVVTLVDDEQREAGYHVAIWSGRNAEGKSVGNGVYFVRMRAGEFAQARKIVLLE